MSFQNFVVTDQSMRHLLTKEYVNSFDDFNDSLNRMFLALIFCAEHKLNVTYKGLCIVSNVPSRYAQGQVMSRVIGDMLYEIGDYCQTLRGCPKLTALCVRSLTRLPGDGFYQEYQTGGIVLGPEEKQELLLCTAQELKKYDWNAEKYELKIKENDIVTQMKELGQNGRYVFPCGD